VKFPGPGVWTAEIEVLVGIGAEHGVPAAQVALAHTPGKPAVTPLIAGAHRDPAQRA
jgi:hypothetical protein